MTKENPFKITGTVISVSRSNFFKLRIINGKAEYISECLLPVPTLNMSDPTSALPSLEDIKVGQVMTVTGTTTGIIPVIINVTGIA